MTETDRQEARQGKFICLEGGDGCGKSTQSKLLEKFLRDAGFKVVLTREPGGTKNSQKIRELIMNPEVNRNPKIALCLFLADRALHLEELVFPALSAGKIVICDRYEMSTMAYQSQAGGLDLDEVRRFNEYVTGGLIPDITILFDVPVEIGQTRKQNTEVERNHYDEAGLEFHRKLRRGYLELAKILPNCVVVDATRTPEEIHQEVVDILKSHGIV